MHTFSRHGSIEIRLSERTLQDLIHNSANENWAIDRKVYLKDTWNTACHTSPQTLSKRVLHRVGFSASCFNFQYLLFFLSHPVAAYFFFLVSPSLIIFSVFPSITRFRRQSLCNVYSELVSFSSCYCFRIFISSFSLRKSSVPHVTKPSAWNLKFVKNGNKHKQVTLYKKNMRHQDHETKLLN